MLSRLVALSMCVFFLSGAVRAADDDPTPIDVYILAGQSNADGRADFHTLPESQQQQFNQPSNVMFYHGAGRPPRAVPAHQWTTLRPGSGTNLDINHRADPAQLNFGPEVGLGQALAERIANRRIAIIKCTQGGTSLAEQWSPKQGPMWRHLTETIDAGLKALRKNNHQPRLIGMVWSQGEKDSQSQAHTDAYQRNLSQFIAAVRSEYGQHLPFVITAIPDSDAMDQRVIEAQRAVSNQDAQTHFVATDDLTLKDVVHFDAVSQVELGRRCAEVLAANRPNESQNETAHWPPLARRLLGIDDGQLAKLSREQSHGLLDIAPVHMPSDATGDCNHYGWPIATMTGDTIVVMHRRIPGHNRKGAGAPDESMSYGIVLRSEDGGQNWSEPYDLRDCMKPADRTRGGLVPLSHRKKFDPDNMSPKGYKIHLHAIGSTRDGAVVAVNNHGVFRSEDAGRTWRHFSTALRDDTFPHEMVNIGPTVVDDPEQGLFVFGNWFGEVDTYHKLSKDLVVLNSKDGGATWKATDHPVGFPQYEPAVLRHEGKYLFVTRDQTKVKAHKQMIWTPGGKPRVLDTNLVNPRGVDTIAFSLNPVTGRFEVVRSERYHMQLWVWSIAPEDWASGQWRREYRLLKRPGRFYADADGFHPAAAVIDAKRGVQHVFIYAGHPNGPAGVFRITRSLNTPAVAKYINSESTE
ncbi:hypothetical protein HED60_18230 [Planctomycetales bacterium ZRK34]|nr:hypothetical protein HED60_18230 [Planctomycetales bacterium ZRK34]